jgi:NAD(P)-dependent dehydrogenase (short-subunit alcohol dehydrogenase family)
MDFPGALDLFDVNTLGPLRLVQAFLPAMLRADNPRIALMSSGLGSMATEGATNIAYRAAKAALNKIAQGLAHDLKREKVTVVALNPGWVRTDMGGKNADLSVEESAVGLIEAIDALTLADTGRFIDYRGRDVPW